MRCVHIEPAFMSAPDSVGSCLSLGVVSGFVPQLVSVAVDQGFGCCRSITELKLDSCVSAVICVRL
ncbi:hypothetical protein M6B38_389020 [Iris pallida]|uniref:Hydrophobin n=1 Tax=Iris pallida TaxID=29817 RepID=A0AAX6G206_IRIPA|nr:hypothetical protein M6B38_389020 [Iris pallida]